MEPQYKVSRLGSWLDSYSSLFDNVPRWKPSLSQTNALRKVCGLFAAANLVLLKIVTSAPAEIYPERYPVVKEIEWLLFIAYSYGFLTLAVNTPHNFRRAGRLGLALILMGVVAYLSAKYTAFPEMQSTGDRLAIVFSALQSFYLMLASITIYELNIEGLDRA